MKIKKLLKVTAVCLIFAIFIACQSKNISEPPPESEYDIGNEYIIGPEDVIQIHVWKQPNISVTVPVRSDGKISIPLTNDIQAAGFTPQKLKEEIIRQLNKFIEEPTVSVIVQEINSQKISVSGRVNAPGIYKIGRKISLVEAISLAGGLTEFANPKKIKIIRMKNNIETIYQVNYTAILSGKDMNQNITLYPGDIVIVPD